MVWDILKEIFWWKGVEGNGRMENILEYSGRKRKKIKGKRNYLIRRKNKKN